MDFRFGLVVWLCLLGLAHGSPFKDCGSKVGAVSSVLIEDCDKVPCVLKKGHQYSINVTFDSNVTSLNCTAVVHGIVAGIPFPFAIDDNNGCRSGINCPIKTKQHSSYITRLPVKESYPSIKVMVKWELRDDKDEDLFCIEFPVSLES